MRGKTRLARDGLRLDPVHDNRHVLPDLPTARESIPYLVHLPDKGIAAFTYTWVNKDDEAGAALAIFGPGVGDQPVQQRLPDRKMAKGADFSNWEIGGFSMRQDLKFKNARVKWETGDALIEFDFEAFHPPYAYSANKDGCPSYAAIDRIEQSGWVKGRFVLNKKEIPFNTLGHRDHSWGTRDWGAFQYYNWFQGQSLDGSMSIHYWRFFALGREHLRGYVVKDGLMAEVTELKTDVGFSDDLWQRKATSKIRDEAGRDTTIEAEFYAHYTLAPSDILHLREGAARATFDGKAGLGWMEIAWPPSYLKHIAANGPY